MILKLKDEFCLSFVDHLRKKMEEETPCKALTVGCSSSLHDTLDSLDINMFSTQC